MYIYGYLKGFKESEIREKGFPVHYIVMDLHSDLFISNSYNCDVVFGTQVILDVYKAEYYFKGSDLFFKVTCNKIFLDGEESQIDADGDLAYFIVKNSLINEMVLGEDYSDFEDPMEKINVNKLKVRGSLEFSIGNHCLHKRSNKIEFN